jgi:hypothetical protein
VSCPQVHRRSLAVLFFGALCCGVLSYFTLAVTAEVASAEPVRPSNFESVIRQIEPATPEIQVKVLGGDSYLQVSAQPGTTVQIPGYDGEPYLRIAADGTVEQNKRSPAVILNSTRGSAMGMDDSGGTATFPDDVSSTAPPEWQRVGSGGKVAWHDHRIHWMVSAPPVTDESEVAQDWFLPLTVNGKEVTVTGELLYKNNSVPWPGLLALVVAAVAAYLGRTGKGRLVLLLAAAISAGALSIGGLLGNPPAAQSSQSLVVAWLPLALSATAAVAAAIALLAKSLSAQFKMFILPLLSVATLAGWVAPRVGLIWMPVVSSVFLSWIERVGTALVIGVLFGVTIAILIRPIPSSYPGLSTDNSDGSQSAIPPTS